MASDFTISLGGNEDRGDMQKFITIDFAKPVSIGWLKEILVKALAPTPDAEPHTEPMRALRPEGWPHIDTYWPHGVPEAGYAEDLVIDDVFVDARDGKPFRFCVTRAQLTRIYRKGDVPHTQLPVIVSQPLLSDEEVKKMKERC